VSLVFGLVIVLLGLPSVQSSFMRLLEEGVALLHSSADGGLTHG